MNKSKKHTLKRGQKKILARKLREYINIPARTICRTMKNSVIVATLKEHQ